MVLSPDACWCLGFFLCSEVVQRLRNLCMGGRKWAQISTLLRLFSSSKGPQPHRSLKKLPAGFWCARAPPPPKLDACCAHHKSTASLSLVSSSILRLFHCGCAILLLLIALISLHKVVSLFPSLYPVVFLYSSADLLACMLCQAPEETQSVLLFTWQLLLFFISVPSPFLRTSLF